jgi:hypothetical protein
MRARAGKGLHSLPSYGDVTWKLQSYTSPSSKTPASINLFERSAFPLCGPDKSPRHLVNAAGRDPINYLGKTVYKGYI